MWNYLSVYSNVLCSWSKHTFTSLHIIPEVITDVDLLRCNPPTCQWYILFHVHAIVPYLFKIIVLYEYGVCLHLFVCNLSIWVSLIRLPSNPRIHQKQKEGGTYSPREAEIIDTKLKLDQLIAVADLELKEEKLNRWVGRVLPSRPHRDPICLHRLVCSPFKGDLPMLQVALVAWAQNPPLRESSASTKLGGFTASVMLKSHFIPGPWNNSGCSYTSVQNINKYRQFSTGLSNPSLCIRRICLLIPIKTLYSQIHISQKYTSNTCKYNHRFFALAIP